MTALLIQDGIDVKGLYTYGAPRVGNRNFADGLNAFSMASYRLVNEGDLVPHLPPEFLQFWHSGKAIMFTDDWQRKDDDLGTWNQFVEGMWAWIAHIGKRDLAIRDYHLLDSENGYIAKLKADLERT